MITKFKLFENPDFVYDKGLEWQDPNTITFAFFNGDLLSKKGKSKHSEIFQEYAEKHNIDVNQLRKEWLEDDKPNDAGRISNFERRITKYPGRLWLDQKVISFWEYPPTYKVLHRIMKEVLSKYNIEFNPKEWLIEIISDAKAEQGKEYYKTGSWDNDPREVYLQKVINYEGSGRRTDREISSQHTLSPIFKTKKSFKTKDLEGRLPGETTAEARWRLRHIYQESNNLKGKFVNVDYKIFHQTWNDKPVALVTDFKIHKIEGNYIEVIGKGYEYVTLSDFGVSTDFKSKNKKGWVPFDDFKNKNVRKFPKKSVQDGTKRIKVYYDNEV